MQNNDFDKPAEEFYEKKRIQLRPEDDPLDITRDPVFKAVLTRETAESRSALRFLVSAVIQRPVTVVSVIANEPPVNAVNYYDSEHNLPFNGLTSIIDVELPKAEQFLTKPVPEMTVIERWAVFFRFIQDPTRRDLINEILNHEEGIAMATTELLTVSQDEIMRARLNHELKNQLDYQSGMVSARRAGYKDAELEYGGKIRALEQERRQAEQERRQMEQQAVQKLRDLGLSDEQIASALGLDGLGGVSG
ncbi:hypothetical protein [Treponema primitia]|uniref:hypothetical protein n=1 Tax=Treponema primitia TaxID=88058 RepID=UPI000255536D|nr:hypothetical protein [Treponema primitia]